MAVNQPKITFLTPLRIFTEDKEFLGQNLVNWLWKQVGKSDTSIEALEEVIMYKIVLSCISSKPVDIAFTKVQAQKVFKDVFPNGKCVGVDVDYVPHKSKSALPVVDFQIFWR